MNRWRVAAWVWVLILSAEVLVAQAPRYSPIVSLSLTDAPSGFQDGYFVPTAQQGLELTQGFFEASHWGIALLSDLLVPREKTILNHGLRYLLIVNPKGRKDRLVPVGETAREYTEAYCRLVRPWMVGSQREKALFVSHRGGGRLSHRSVSEIVLHAARASGLEKRITPHSFAPRHGHASAAQPGAT